MEDKLYEKRLESRMAQNPEMILRERAITKLQASFGYDHA